MLGILYFGRKKCAFTRSSLCVVIHPLLPSPSQAPPADGGGTLQLRGHDRPRPRRAQLHDAFWDLAGVGIRRPAGPEGEGRVPAEGVGQPVPLRSSRSRQHQGLLRLRGTGTAALRPPRLFIPEGLSSFSSGTPPPRPACGHWKARLMQLMGF